MKKLLFLALAVSLIAGSAFAMTDPAFSGSFEYYNSFNFGINDTESGDAGDAVINLNGVVDEWTTVKAELEADSGQVVELNNLSLTTDLTGALGLESPVGVTITWGAFTYEPATFADKAGYEDLGAGQETATYVGLQIDLDFMGVATLSGTIWPSTYVPTSWTNQGVAATGNAAFAVELVVPGIAGVVDANVYFTRDLDRLDGVVPDPIYEIGTTVGVTIPAGFELGFIFEWYLVGDANEIAFGQSYGEVGVAAAWALGDVLALGVALGTANLLDFAATSVIAVNVGITPVTGLQFYGSFGINNFNAIAFQYEVGIQAALGATTYTIGWTDNSEFRTPDWSYDKPDNTLYLKVTADY